jgi:predicted transcriptional regulator
MNNTVTLPQSIIKRLEIISANSRRSPESIVKQAVTTQLDYEEWALAQIDAGLADIKAGRVLSDDEFWKKLGSTQDDRKKAA